MRNETPPVAEASRCGGDARTAVVFAGGMQKLMPTRDRNIHPTSTQYGVNEVTPPNKYAAAAKLRIPNARRNGKNGGIWITIFFLIIDISILTA